ncbi:MAG: hypothetical protein ABIJ81_02460 [Patescibacteria group bacterium]
MTLKKNTKIEVVILGRQLLKMESLQLLLLKLLSCELEKYRLHLIQIPLKTTPNKVNDLVTSKVNADIDTLLIVYNDEEEQELTKLSASLKDIVSHIELIAGENIDHEQELHYANLKKFWIKTHPEIRLPAIGLKDLKSTSPRPTHNNPWPKKRRINTRVIISGPY